jgi:hypothetical protein
MESYFVVVFARDTDSLRALQKFELDVFPHTSKRSPSDKEYPFAIDGLLSIKEIEEVVKAGYRVYILDPAEKRARAAGNVMEFPEWLERMQPALTAERTKKKKR